MRTHMKNLLLPLILAVGCTTPHKYTNPGRPQDITLEDLAAVAESVEDHYQKFNQVEGVVWQAMRSDSSLSEPDIYGSGGDSALFGGYKLAADVFRYRVTETWADLLRVEQSLRGLYILTHITGKPGVIARCAFPLEAKEKWNYPQRWQKRINEGFCHESKARVRDPFRGRLFPEMVYYTRATKDQLTGLLLGLGVTWKYLKVTDDQDPDEQELTIKCRNVVAQIAVDIYQQLHKYNFKIRDENGKNDTNADTVSGALKLQLLAVYKEAINHTNPSKLQEVQKEFDDTLGSSMPELGDYFHIFNNYFQYFAWNLRHAVGYTVYILSDSNDVKKNVSNWYADFLWPYIKGHQNAWFIYLQNVLDPSKGKLQAANIALRSMALRPTRGTRSPYSGDSRNPTLLEILFTNTDDLVIAPHLRKVTSYYLWQKEPWDTGNGVPNSLTDEDPTGLDFILPYWMSRFYGMLR